MTTWEALERANDMQRIIYERDYAFERANDANRRTIFVGAELAAAVRTLEILAEPMPLCPLAHAVESETRPRISAEAAAKAYDAMGGYPFTDPR